MHQESDDTLYKYIPKEAIPRQDYKNLMDSSETVLSQPVALLDQYEGWFEDDEQLARLDESKCLNNKPKVAKRSSFFRSFMGGKSADS